MLVIFWGYHVMFLYDKEVNVREDPELSLPVNSNDQRYSILGM